MNQNRLRPAAFRGVKPVNTPLFGQSLQNTPQAARELRSQEPAHRSADTAQPGSNRPTEEVSRRLSRDQLTAQYLSLVSTIARRVFARVPSSIDLDDLIQEGCIGLLAAIERYDARIGVPLSVFARHRIKGAILDMLRGTDWVPRSVRRRANRLSSVTAELTERLGRAPTREELRGELGISAVRLERMERNSELYHVTSLDAPASADSDQPLVDLVADPTDPYAAREEAEVLLAVHAAMSTLPVNEERAVRRYFLDERGLKEIARELGISESRASQLRRGGTTHLAERLGALLTG